MECYDLQEKNNILTITFHQNSHDLEQVNKLELYHLKDYIANSKCSILICDLSKSNYERGDYISAGWLYGALCDKKVYVVAKESQIDALKSLMKMNIEVPIYTDINDVPGYVVV